jgi:hypothetical protein
LLRTVDTDIPDVQSISAESDQDNENIMLCKNDRSGLRSRTDMEIKCRQSFKPEVADCIVLCYCRLSDAFYVIAEVKAARARAVKSVGGDMYVGDNSLERVLAYFHAVNLRLKKKLLRKLRENEILNSRVGN